MIEKNKQEKKKKGVQIMTMHKSKGMEWNTVFLISVNDKILPGRTAETQDDIEEERRLLYVAMTRAKDNLYISCSGAESSFMKTTMVKYKEKTTPKIKKKLGGSPVEHNKFGKGRVLNYVGDYISIKFSDGTKKFKFPDAFEEGYLRYL